MEKRFMGIDIIKVLAVILVVSLHFFLNYGFYKQPYVGYGKVIQESIRWISLSCIGLFLMSTGFLQSNKTANKKYYKKITNYVIPFLIYSFLTAIIIHGVINTNVFYNTMYYFLRFPGYYWYISFFLGLYLLIPYFNIILNNISDKKQFQYLMIILIFVTAIPEFVNNIPTPFKGNKLLFLPNWWKEFFPITYYVFGAYYRKFQPKIHKGITVLILLITAFGISVVDYRFSAGEPAKAIGGGYGSVINVIITVCIFSLFYDTDMQYRFVSKTMSFLSSITLEIYLGYIISDKYTQYIITMYFKKLTVTYNAKLYFIEVPLNFTIAMLIAIIFKICLYAANIVFNKRAGRQEDMDVSSKHI